MAARHITIGPEFFVKAKNDYANWHWAIVREFFQNCIDCGSSRIVVTCSEVEGATHLTVINDGVPMDEDILLNKLLSLGSSGKNFDGTTGGFGKAKEILYFCHKEYRIHSGSLLVDGAGAAYDLRTDADFLDGTRSDIVIEGCHEYELMKMMKRFISYTQWSGTFVVNGEELYGTLRKGSPRRDLGFAKVYTNRSDSYTMIVRMNGTPMFAKGISFDRCVIVELKGKSDEVLTSNRDGLVEEYSDELSDFVTELAVDKRSALKDRRRGPRYIQYRGKKMCHQRELDVVDVVAVAAKLTEAVTGTAAPVEAEPTAAGVAVSLTPPSPPSYQEEVETEGRPSARDMPTGTYTPERVATLGTNFILKNETDLKVPAYYDPGSGEFSEYSRKLVRIWGRLMIEMHRMFDVEGEFSVGFIFDDGDEVSTEAEHEDGDFGKVYYLNPCVVVEQNYTYSKSFKKRFKLTERDRLIMIALHEFIHGLGLSWHDERYANKLTDMAAKVMKERKRFGWCFG